MAILGIDIGGSGIKGNLVDVSTGEMVAERFKLDTPQPSLPAAVARTVAEMVRHFEYSGPVGCTFPAIVRRGVTLSAANVDRSWIGTNAQELFERATSLPVTVINDADAAGIAEMRFGAGRDRDGVVMILTFGTGIGSAVFVDGVLVPNTELGHLQLAGYESVEDWASSRVKTDEDLSYREWAVRVDRYLHHLNWLFSPDLFIIGGGISRKFDRFGHLLTVGVETVPAELRNEAGIVGAAMAATSR